MPVGGKRSFLAEKLGSVALILAKNMVFFVSYSVGHGQVAPAVCTDFISEIRKTPELPTKTNR
jgi:hypothetical protein